MDTIMLTHQGRPVALAAQTRVWFAAHIQALPDWHPRKRLVCFMALYARDVLTGTLPGPYTDTRAEHFARLALIDPDIIASHPHATDTELADLLAVPIEQLNLLSGCPDVPVGVCELVPARWRIQRALALQPGEAFVQRLTRDAQLAGQQREADARHLGGCGAQLKQLCARVVGGLLARTSLGVGVRDAAEDQAQDAGAVPRAGGVVKRDRPPKQRALPAPRELLAPRRLDAPAAVAPVAPAATTAQPRNLSLRGRVDRSLRALSDVGQQRAQLLTLAARQRKRSAGELLIGAPRGIQQITQRVLRTIIPQWNCLDLRWANHDRQYVRAP